LPTMQQILTNNISVKEDKSKYIRKEVKKMNWLLERLERNSTMEMTAGVDFYDGLGVLLLRKGQMITKGIRDLLQYLTLGALLHDLGKLRVPKEILNKQGSLTEDEFAIMKQHPLLGVEMLKNTRLLPCVLETVKNHHER